MASTSHARRPVNGHHPGGMLAKRELGEIRHRLGRDLARADAFTRRLGRERPLLAAGLALTAGFVIGRLVARHG